MSNLLDSEIQNKRPVEAFALFYYQTKKWIGHS